MKRLGVLTALAAALWMVPVANAEAGKCKHPPVRVGVGLHVDVGPGFPGHASSGHYEWCEQRVWVPERYELQWVERRQPDREEWRTEQVWVPGGTALREERVLVAPGRWEIRYQPGCRSAFQRVWIPPQYDTRLVPVEQPGHWETRRTRVCIQGEVYRVQECVLVPGHYETVTTKVWVPSAACAPRATLSIGGNHGGFGFSLSLSGR